VSTGEVEDRKLTLEITVHPRSFEGKTCQLVVVRNVTHVLQHENLRTEFEYIQLLIKTMSHEQLTPLNAILNLSEYHLKGLREEKPFSAGEQKYYMEVIWSSARILEYGTKSQLTQLQLQANTYEFNQETTSRDSLKGLVEKVAAPFRIQLLDLSAELEIVQTPSVPPRLNHDRKLYEECLFNIMQNAAKFNKRGGRVKVT